MLNINGLSFSYKGATKPLLQHLDLQMADGDILGLLGPNGAGKTSLVSLISGILRPDAGEILIAGKPAQLGRTDIALVPQEYAFYERLSGRENLAYFAGILGLTGTAAKAAVNQALADCELTDLAERRAGHYSGGLKRRLNFAVALLQQPRLLILDEPTAGVDPHSRSFLLDLVRKQNKAGTSVIYTSHLLDEVQALCSHIAVMDKGEILLQGAIDTLLAQTTRRLTAVVRQPLNQDVAREFGATLMDDYTLQFERQTQPFSPAQQLQKLEAAGFEIRRLNYGERRLEELFFELTRRELRD